MDLRLGAIVVLTKELTEELTGSSKNNKFIVSVVADEAASLKNLGDRRTYNVRTEVLQENIKWTEDKFEEHDKPRTSSPKPSPEKTSNDVIANISGFKVDFKGSAAVDSSASGVYTVTPKSDGKAGITRVSASSSYTTNDDSPYDDGGGVYG